MLGFADTPAVDEVLSALAWSLAEQGREEAYGVATRALEHARRTNRPDSMAAVAVPVAITRAAAGDSIGVRSILGELIAISQMPPAEYAPRLPALVRTALAIGDPDLGPPWRRTSDRCYRFANTRSSPCRHCLLRHAVTTTMRRVVSPTRLLAGRASEAYSTGICPPGPRPQPARRSTTRRRSSRCSAAPAFAGRGRTRPLRDCDRLLAALGSSVRRNRARGRTYATPAEARLLPTGLRRRRCADAVDEVGDRPHDAIRSEREATGRCSRWRCPEDKDRLQAGFDPGHDIGVHPVADHRGCRGVRVDRAKRRAHHQRVRFADVIGLDAAGPRISAATEPVAGRAPRWKPVASGLVAMNLAPSSMSRIARVIASKL